MFSKLSVDTPVGHVIRCNINAVQSHSFAVVGKMLATMIVQGGKPPRLFSNGICQYIQSGFDNAFPGIDEVPDATIRNSLTKV